MGAALNYHQLLALFATVAWGTPRKYCAVWIMGELYWYHVCEQGLGNSAIFFNAQLDHAFAIFDLNWHVWRVHHTKVLSGAKKERTQWFSLWSKVFLDKGIIVT